MSDPFFHVVLHQPLIPNNTGNIGRSCMALGCALHLIRPLGFDTDEKACRRAGLDYWPRLGVREHDSWADFASGRLDLEAPRAWFFSTAGTRSHWEADFRAGDALIFGSETVGLPRELLGRYPDRCVRLPMVAGERSLNLANSVCVALYEGLRQCRGRGEVTVDADGVLRRRPDRA